MRVSYRWLTNILGIRLPLDELLNRLTMAGLEVEAVTDLGAGNGKLVAARILSKDPHPNADNLSLCNVQAGEGEPFRIVCGAKNMKPGDLVPLALEGARLPNGMIIKKSKIRGEASQGMMCSGRELEWSEDHEGLLILPPADEHALYTEGEPFEALIEIKVTPNRPDCLSIYGIARDLSAILGRSEPPRRPVAPKSFAGLPAGEQKPAVEAPDACPLYVGRVIENVKIGPSPLWLRRAVESGGLRSINNVVDVTNYILLEQGQPLHAFDLGKVSGTITIRKAKDGEKAETLDGQEVTLTPDDLLIADDEKPIALAGIMGCENSEIDEATTRVFLEAAWFDPTTIRKTSKRLAKSTDSSYRFERGIDWSSVESVADRAAELIAEVSGGTVSAAVKCEGKLPDQPVIELDTDRANRLLGLVLEVGRMRGILTALGFAIEEKSAGTLLVKAPGHRPDVTVAADLVEEIVRVQGYDSVPSELPRIQATAGASSPEYQVTRLIQDTWSGLGLHEAVSFSFEPAEASAKTGLKAKAPLTLANPLSGEFAVMRSGILPGLLAACSYNHNRGNTNLGLFEIGKIYAATSGDGVSEEWAFGAVLSGGADIPGWRNDKRPVDFFDGKALAEALLQKLCPVEELDWVRPDDDDGDDEVFHPGKCAIAELDGTPLLWIGQAHPNVRKQWDLKRDVILVRGTFAALTPLLNRTRKIAPVPQFPSLTRDLALVADRTIASADIAATISKRAKSLLTGLELFDVYEGEKVSDDKRSLAWTLEFSAPDRTLTDDEVNQLIERILADLKVKHSVELRA